jgi:hypothetical protein
VQSQSIQPPALSRFLGYFSLRRLAVMPFARAFPPIRPSATAAAVLAVLGSDVLNLACRDPHDMDRVADYIGGAFFALRASGHQSRSSISQLNTTFDAGLGTFDGL